MPHTFQTLRFRLMFSFSTIILSCVLFISLLGVRIFSTTFEQQNIKHTAQMLEQVQHNLDSYVQETEHIIDTISSDDSVLAFMRLQIGNEVLRPDKEMLARLQLENYIKHAQQIRGLIAVCENGRYISNEFYRVAKDPLQQESWYQKAAKSSQKLIISPKPIVRNIRNWNHYSNYEIVMLSKAVIDPETLRVIGVVAADLRLERMETFLQGLTLGQKGSIFVLDESGQVVYAPVNDLVYRVRPQWFEQGNPSYFYAKIGEESFSFLSSTSNYTGWKTVGMFSQKAPSSALRSLQNVILVVSLITLIFGVLTALLLTRTITKPILLLQKLMKKAEGGDLEVVYQNKNNFDVDELGQSFNTMIEKINSLLQLVVTEQRSKREAELRALQAQINPHFLYNTLDTIHWMANEYQATDIVEMVSALTKLFRIGLSKGQEYIFLKDEVIHVQSYLLIQKIRYEEKLNYRFKIDLGLEQANVLKLILQPLIENAIYHGIKPKKGNGMILISITKCDHILLMRVSDDGVGMSEDALKKLNDSLRENANHQGYGIYNVNERLKMHFGDEYTLSLESNEFGGITSIIRHPLIFERNAE